MPKIKYIDIKGQRFGKLLVKEYISGNRWLANAIAAKRELLQDHSSYPDITNLVAVYWI